jgi:hypothetical protein
MSTARPSRATRRILQLASLGLAGLLAGLLTGCSSNTAAQVLSPRVDTDWQTASTYASATAALPPRSAARSAHVRPCLAAPCELTATSSRARSHHHTM